MEHKGPRVDEAHITERAEKTPEKQRVSMQAGGMMCNMRVVHSRNENNAEFSISHTPASHSNFLPIYADV